MKRYIDKETDRYQFMVRETLNGYSIEVLIVPTGDIVGLTPQVRHSCKSRCRSPTAFRAAPARMPSNSSTSWPS